uniref:Minor glycoprotein n=1 Tax=Kibale red colobus virus 2 TaxID=1936072 RepID=X2D717_9NIDO|nr:minor glycoprotein [Kibale red colobus virus 2]
MGRVHSRVIATLLALSLVDWHCRNVIAEQHCMNCHGHNTTNLREVAVLQKDQPIVLYGDDCWNKMPLGKVKSVVEAVTTRPEGLDEAFTVISFASCLARAIHLRQNNVSVTFIVDVKQQLYMCYNFTALPVNLDAIQKPWFIHAGALRWGTVICGIYAVIRAMHYG